jgi:hypothetical protein
LKDGFDSIVDSKLIDFEKKLRDGDRPWILYFRLISK